MSSRICLIMIMISVLSFSGEHVECCNGLDSIHVKHVMDLVQHFVP